MQGAGIEGRACKLGVKKPIYIHVRLPKGSWQEMVLLVGASSSLVRHSHQVHSLWERWLLLLLP